MSEKKYKTVISIDCMGGDLGEQEVLKGIIKAYKENNSLFFIIHGAGKKLPQLLFKQKSLLNAYRYVESGNIVSMSDKPSQALRKARNTTMWNALTSVSNGEAEVAISCGNTGALMAMSMMKLKKINGITDLQLLYFGHQLTVEDLIFYWMQGLILELMRKTYVNML